VYADFVRVLTSIIIMVMMCWQSPALADRAADKAMAQGRRHYDLREWDEAIAKFKEAYSRAPSREALFDLAQAYRQKGDCEDAAGFYKTYLRNFPGASNRAQAEQLAAEMEACAKPQRAPEPDKPEPQASEPVAAKPPEEPEPAGRRHSTGRLVSYGLGAGGLVGLGLAGKFALDGRASDRDLQTQCKTSCTQQQAAAIDRAGHDANRDAWISLAAGGALLVGAVATFWWSRDHHAESRAIAIGPARDGVAATLTVGF
jgi:tetratricopeptide (TPR) repeat protein